MITSIYKVWDEITYPYLNFNGAIWFLHVITCYEFSIEPTNLHQIYIFILAASIENEDHWHWPSRSFGHLTQNSMKQHSTSLLYTDLQYIPRNMHTVFALLCFFVVIHWLIFPYPSGLLYWHCGNLTIAPMPAKQPWWIRINTSCEFIMNDCITTTKQSTAKPCAYFLGYTVLI